MVLSIQNTDNLCFYLSTMFLRCPMSKSLYRISEHNVKQQEFKMYSVGLKNNDLRTALSKIFKTTIITFMGPQQNQNRFRFLKWSYSLCIACSSTC